MIIKTGDYELEILRGSDVYLGSRRTGQTFKKWSEIDENVKIGLENILSQAENLIKNTEALLSTT